MRCLCTQAIQELKKLQKFKKLFQESCLAVALKVYVAIPRGIMEIARNIVSVVYCCFGVKVR